MNALRGRLAEELFERYLKSQGLDWEHEPPGTKKRPDYVVPHSAHRCVFEVKTLYDPNPMPASGYPHIGIQEKVHRSRKQFGEFRDACCCVVLYTESIFYVLDPEAVSGCIFGPLFERNPGLQEVDSGPPRLSFPRRRPLVSHSPVDKAGPVLSADFNRTVSAVVILSQYALPERNLAIWKEVQTRSDAGEDVSGPAFFRLLSRLQDTLPTNVRFEGTIRTIVLENPHARIRFPSELFRGPFDQRWAQDGECYRPVWLGSTLAELGAHGVHFRLL
jgi:hypothetical protein